MQKWRFKLNFEVAEVIIDPRVTRLRLFQGNGWAADKRQINGWSDVAYPLICLLSVAARGWTSCSCSALGRDL
jgi:hypothetical protein